MAKNGFEMLFVIFILSINAGNMIPYLRYIMNSEVSQTMLKRTLKI